MVIHILSWYLTLQLFALAGLPLAFVWLRRLPSRGYAAAKALGLLLSGVLFWWSGILHLGTNSAGTALTMAGLIFAAGLWALRSRGDELRAWWQANRSFVLLTEALFADAFLLWVAVRAAQPQLETAGGEKWMEIAFLNAILRSPAMPPHDPWLSGFAISYYYLGYVLLGMVTRVATVPATIAFNLGGAGWFALAAAGAYGIVYDLLGGRHPTRPLFGPLLLLLTGNAEGLLEVLHARGLLPAAFWRWLDIKGLNTAPTAPFSWIPSRYFWWWRASRTLHDYTPWGSEQEVIDEFPAFSFILGDLHPHVLALPFVLLAVTLAFALYLTAREGAEQPWPGLPRRWSQTFSLNPWQFLGGAFLLGALGFLNTWDFPIYWAVVVGALVLGTANQRIKASTRERTGEGQPNGLWAALLARLPEAVALGVASVLLYLPFWVGLRSQAGGILPNFFNATRLPQFAVMFAPLLVPVVAVLIGAARRAGVALWEVFGLGATLVIGFLLVSLLLGLVVGYPYVTAVLRGEPVPGLDVPPQLFVTALLHRLANPWTALGLAAGVLAAVLALARDKFWISEETAADRPFAVLLVLVGLLLTLAPEFVFLRDVFTDRMNTVFKFYFQAWVLWSLAGAWWLAQAADNTFPAAQDRWSAIGSTVAQIVAYLLIIVGMIYTGLAAPARAQEHGTPWTLDGAAWIAGNYPQDWAAIGWLNANVTGRPVILEAPGDNHRAYVYEGRVAALTGLPTLLGWAGHEWQWRGTYEEQTQREQDIATLFTTSDPALTRQLLQQYDVTYIYVGPTEHQRYPATGLEKFAQLFPAVYQNEGVTIYQVQELRD